MSALLGSASPRDVVLFVARASSIHESRTTEIERLEQSLDFTKGKYKEEYGLIRSPAVSYSFIFIQSSNRPLTTNSGLSQCLASHLTEVSQQDNPNARLIIVVNS
jgi:ABC-type uncharacterized transport system involved in gliding motility auxiliary subunit